MDARFLGRESSFTQQKNLDFAQFIFAVFVSPYFYHVSNLPFCSSLKVRFRDRGLYHDSTHIQLNQVQLSVIKLNVYIFESDKQLLLPDDGPRKRFGANAKTNIWYVDYYGSKL